MSVLSKPAAEPVAPGLTAEQEIALWAIRVDEVHDERARALVRSGVDWTALTREAGRHGVIPLLYARLVQVAGDLVPAERLATLRSLYRNNAARNLVLTHALLVLLDCLATAGVAALPFKGAALAVQAYGDLALRQFVDHDILVSPGDFPATFDALVSAGYRPTFPITPQMHPWLLRLEKEFTFSQGNGSVDVHWRLADAAARMLGAPSDIDALWRDLATVPLLDRHTAVLSPANELLAICAHGAGHGYQELKWVADVAHLLHRHGDLPLLDLLADSEARGVSFVLPLGLCLAERYGGWQMPPPVREQVLADARVRQVISRIDIRRILAGESERDDLRWMLLRGLGQRLWYRASGTVDALFRPRVTDWVVLPLPDVLYPLYYGFRPPRLLAKHSTRALSRLANKTTDLRRSPRGTPRPS